MDESLVQVIDAYYADQQKKEQAFFEGVFDSLSELYSPAVSKILRNNAYHVPGTYVIRLHIREMAPIEIWGESDVDDFVFFTDEMCYPQTQLGMVLIQASRCYAETQLIAETKPETKSFWERIRGRK